MLRKMLRLTLGAALLLSLAPALRASDLPQPAEEVILTVTGAISATNSASAAQFDQPMLAALGETSIETSTIWTDGEHVFTGVSLKALIEALGIGQGSLAMLAVNDYMIEVPVSDAVENGPIIAYAMDGQRMTLRDKGPLWLIYPYDEKDEYRSDVIYARSIWQLDRIEVLP